jgi:hypothetical protein
MRYQAGRGNGRLEEYEKCKKEIEDSYEEGFAGLEAQVRYQYTVRVQSF